MNNARIQLQVTSLFYTNLECQLLLVILLKLLLEREHGLDFAYILSWGLCPLAAIYCEAESIAHREFRANSRQIHIRLIFSCNWTKFPGL